MDQQGYNIVQRRIWLRTTKALGPDRHRKLAKMMGIGTWQKSGDYGIMKMDEKYDGEGEGLEVAKV